MVITSVTYVSRILKSVSFVRELGGSIEGGRTGLTSKQNVKENILFVYPFGEVSL